MCALLWPIPACMLRSQHSIPCFVDSRRPEAGCVEGASPPFPVAGWVSPHMSRQLAAEVPHTTAMAQFCTFNMFPAG